MNTETRPSGAFKVMSQQDPTADMSMEELGDLVGLYTPDPYLQRERKPALTLHGSHHGE
jgi:hypothetical protein